MDISWGRFDDDFLDDFVTWIAGRSVLEVFAGNGLLASKLHARGVDIVSTSLFCGHDGHDRRMYFDVIEMRADIAAATYSDRDIMIMSWPTADDGAIRAALAWGEQRPFVFIGEVTDRAIHQLGGCGSDIFFELSTVAHTFTTYKARNMLESAAVRVTCPDARTLYEEYQANNTIQFLTPLRR